MVNWGRSAPGSLQKLCGPHYQLALTGVSQALVESSKEIFDPNLRQRKRLYKNPSN